MNALYWIGGLVAAVAATTGSQHQRHCCCGCQTAAHPRHQAHRASTSVPGRRQSRSGLNARWPYGDDHATAQWPRGVASREVRRV